MVNWRLQLGGMYNPLRYESEESHSSRRVGVLLGLELQVPVSERWYIETGVNLRFTPTTYTYVIDGDSKVAEFIPFKDFNDGKYVGTDHVNGFIITDTNASIDIPLRAGWKWILNGNNQFQFGFGPYFGILPQAQKVMNEKIEHSSGLSVGLSPSVVFKHRALSLGLFYQNPCIYNGSRNRETNTLMFTIGVNFNGRKPNWDNIAAGLEAASGVLNEVNTNMANYYGTDGGDDSGNSYYGNSSTGASTSRSTNNDTGSNRVARNRDYNTYFQYETTVIKILNGDDKTNNKKDIQRRMKALRDKWTKRNDGWNASPYETK